MDDLDGVLRGVGSADRDVRVGRDLMFSNCWLMRRLLDGEVSASLFLVREGFVVKSEHWLLLL